MNTKPYASLRGIVALATVVIAVLVAISTFSGWGMSAESPPRDAAERKAQDAAEIWCNVDVVPGLSGIDDPAYRECVKQRTEEEMATWDARH